jgi:hypothetical protein
MAADFNFEQKKGYSLLGTHSVKIRANCFPTLLLTEAVIFFGG